MKAVFMQVLLLLAVAAPVSAALKPGDAAPDFKVQATRDGKASPYSLKDALKRGPVVVYFFPTAYGGGCSIQAHAFAEKSEQFASAGASIVGISLDSIDRLNEFSADPQYCAGKFPVASDADGSISKAYDLEVKERESGTKDRRGQAVTRPRVERTTFIVGTDGRVAASIGGLSAAENVDQALAALHRQVEPKPLPNKS